MALWHSSLSNVLAVLYSSEPQTWEIKQSKFEVPKKATLQSIQRYCKQLHSNVECAVYKGKHLLRYAEAESVVPEMAI